MSKILTIVGARPQFIKASVVSSAILEMPNLSEVLVHTGQHFDANMSDIFFGELGIPQPSYNLNISGGSHGAMTGAMLQELEQVMVSESPDVVIVYGDTNSTLAGALAASKLHIPLAHVEAGLRSFNKFMPEEINRILTDQMSDVLYCPTETAIDNLDKEGFKSKPVEVINVGDVMQDSALLFSQYANKPSGLESNKGFILTTLHRAENTDCPYRLEKIVDALNELHRKIPIILPLHPRTRNAIANAGLKLIVNTINPVGYFQMLWLLKNCSLVLTDSGGVQKEAFFFNKPCVTMRDQTEWVELIEVGANVLVGADSEMIISKVQENIGRHIHDVSAIYGGGRASSAIAQHLSEKF